MAPHRSHPLRAQLRLAAAVLVTATGVLASEATITDLKLHELTRFRRLELSEFLGKPLILTVFQPSCEPCARELEALKCLKAKLPATQIVAVGIGEPDILKKEIRPLKLDFPAVESTTAFQERIGGVSSTPLTLIVDKTGKIVSRKTGDRSCTEWVSAVAASDPGGRTGRK